MSAADEYRVWVGCLACYNGGALVGEWFAGAEAPQSMADFNEAVKVSPAHVLEDHEEMWVFDHEGSPVRSEYGPSDAVGYAEALEGIEAEELPYYLAWLDNQHEPFLDGDIEKFRESRTRHTDLADYVAEIYDGAGKVPDWIQPHIWKVYESMAEDMIYGGDVYLLLDEWFHAH